jgi:hypothetical protein
MLCKPSYSLLLHQNPKLSNKELDSGSSNTLGGGWCPPDFISNGNVGIGRSATTNELRLRSIDLGSGPPMLLKIVGAGRRNSQLRTADRLELDRIEDQVTNRDLEQGDHNPSDRIAEHCEV